MDRKLAKRRENLELTDIKNCNEYTSKYGLSLTDAQIKDIIERKKDSLNETGRLEFRESIINKIIKEFCDSPYIFQDNYADTLYELIEIFYQYKNETMDLISDDELITFMKESFDNICQGDLEYLSGTVMYKMRENVLDGKPLDYKEKEDGSFEEY